MYRVEENKSVGYFILDYQQSVMKSQPRVFHSEECAVNFRRCCLARGHKYILWNRSPTLAHSNTLRHRHGVLLYKSARLRDTTARLLGQRSAGTLRIVHDVMCTTLSVVHGQPSSKDTDVRECVRRSQLVVVSRVSRRHTVQFG